jgi:hypothetical protein
MEFLRKKVKQIIWKEWIHISDLDLSTSIKFQYVMTRKFCSSEFIYSHL